MLAIGTSVAVAMCSQLFIAKYLMVNELYPTAVRNLAVSAVSTMSRIGSMFSPQLFYLVSLNQYFSPTSLVFRVTSLNGFRTQCSSDSNSSISSSSASSFRRPKEFIWKIICLRSTKESSEDEHKPRALIFHLILLTLLSVVSNNSNSNHVLLTSKSPPRSSSKSKPRVPCPSTSSDLCCRRRVLRQYTCQINQRKKEVKMGVMSGADGS